MKWLARQVCCWDFLYRSEGEINASRYAEVVGEHLEECFWSEHICNGWLTFLFEFQNKHMQDHILQGEWCWKNLKIHLGGLRWLDAASTSSIRL